MEPVKNKIKRNSQGLFNSDMSEELMIWDKFCKKYQKSRLHIDKKIYKAAQFTV